MVGEAIGKDAAETAVAGAEKVVEELGQVEITAVSQLLTGGKELLDRFERIIGRFDGANIHFEANLTIKLSQAKSTG